MVFPLLECFPRLVLGVAVVQPADITQRNPALIQVIQKAAAIGVAIGWPAKAVHDFAGADAVFRHLPQFFDANRIALRVAVGIQVEAFDQALGQMSARTFGQYGDFGVDINTGGEAGLVAAIFGHAHIADAHADHFSGVVVQSFGSGKAGIDFHTQGFGLRCQPCTHRAQADDHIAVVVHARRHRQFAAARFGEQPELIVFGVDADRRWVAAPIG